MIFSLNSELNNCLTLYSKTFLFNQSFNLNFLIMKTLKNKIENKKQLRSYFKKIKIKFYLRV